MACMRARIRTCPKSSSLHARARYLQAADVVWLHLMGWQPACLSGASIPACLPARLQFDGVHLQTASCLMRWALWSCRSQIVDDPNEYEGAASSLLAPTRGRVLKWPPTSPFPSSS